MTILFSILEIEILYDLKRRFMVLCANMEKKVTFYITLSMLQCYYTVISNNL